MSSFETLHSYFEFVFLIFYFQVCLVVSLLPSLMIVGMVIHLAGTTLIRQEDGDNAVNLLSKLMMCRYWYVSSSINPELQNTIKRDKFVMVSLLIPQARSRYFHKTCTNIYS